MLASVAFKTDSNRPQPPPTALATPLNRLPNRPWALRGPFPSNASLTPRSQATEIRYVHEQCNVEITDDDIWFRMATCHESFRRQSLPPAEPEDPVSPPTSPPSQGPSIDDLMAVRYEHYAAHPGLLPEAWLESTLKLHREAQRVAAEAANGPSAVATPTNTRKLSGGKGRRKSTNPDPLPRFSYTPAVDGADRSRLRHAVIVALDRYANGQIQDTTHCIHDARMLGKVCGETIVCTLNGGFSTGSQHDCFVTQIY